MWSSECELRCRELSTPCSMSMLSTPCSMSMLSTPCCFADFRPEPAIVTTRCPSFDTDRCHHQQSHHHELDKQLLV